MGRIITADKKGKLQQLEEGLNNFMHGVARDMSNFWRQMSTISIIIDAHTKLLGEERVKAEVDAFVAKKAAEEKAALEPQVKVVTK